MKKTLQLSGVILFFLFQPAYLKAQQVYQNEEYRFSVKIPNNWKLYGQIIDDQVNHRAIADWGLPPIYSELEKTDIENSISITAYKRTDIHSVSELIAAEYLKVDPAKTALEVDGTSTNSRIIYDDRGGLKYKGKSYFAFSNGISYVITFMATPGTFDKNSPIFESFFRSVKFN